MQTKSTSRHHHVKVTVVFFLLKLLSNLTHHALKLTSKLNQQLLRKTLQSSPNLWTSTRITGLRSLENSQESKRGNNKILSGLWRRGQSIWPMWRGLIRVRSRVRWMSWLGWSWWQMLRKLFRIDNWRLTKFNMRMVSKKTAQSNKMQAMQITTQPGNLKDLGERTTESNSRAEYRACVVFQAKPNTYTKSTTKSNSSHQQSSSKTTEKSHNSSNSSSPSTASSNNYPNK